MRGGVGRKKWGVLSDENDTNASTDIVEISANDIEFKTETHVIQDFIRVHKEEGKLIASKIQTQLSLSDDQFAEYIQKAKHRQRKYKYDIVQKIPQVSQKTFIHNKDELSLSKSVTTAMRTNQNLTGKICQKILQKHKQDKQLSNQDMKISEETEVKTEMAQMLSTMKQSQKLPSSKQAQKELKQNLLPLNITYLSWEIAEIIEECCDNISNSLNSQYSDLLGAVEPTSNSTMVETYVKQMTDVMNEVLKIEVAWMIHMLGDMPQLIHDQLTRHFTSIAMNIKQEFESNLRDQLKQ